jgi:hypothetical protein
MIVGPWGGDQVGHDSVRESKRKEHPVIAQMAPRSGKMLRIDPRCSPPQKQALHDEDAARADPIVRPAAPSAAPDLEGLGETFVLRALPASGGNSLGEQ